MSRILSFLLSWSKAIRSWVSRELSSTALLLLATLFAIALARSHSREAIGGAIAVFTLVASQTFESIRRRSEERRWHAERFLDHKINSIRALYVTLSDWKRALNQYGNFTPKTFDEFQLSLVAKETLFMDALAAASVYLPFAVEASVCKAMGVCRRAQMAVYYALPELSSTRPRPPDSITCFPWIDFMQETDAAFMILKPLLYPRSLKDLEDRLS